MTRSVAFILILILSVPFMGCSEEPPSATHNEDASVDQFDILTRSVASAANRKKPGETGLSSPLFGLATSPNRDILVADAGAGVAVLVDGVASLDMVLPGVTDVSPIGRGSAWATVGGAESPGDVGQGLFRISRGGPRMLVNLFAFEAANDPDGVGADSNPFDVASLGGDAALVADAAANDLLRIDNEGKVDVLAVFPTELVSTANLQTLIGCPTPFVPPLAFVCNVPVMDAQAVPTSVAIGPDGYYYVGELKGFPGPVNESRIWRVAPGASWADCGASPDCVKVFDGGFTSVIDLAFDESGLLYVVELDELSFMAIEVLGLGSGGTISACDLNTLTCSEVATGIPMVTAITFGEGGSLWATRNSLIPNLAGVVQIP